MKFSLVAIVLAAAGHWAVLDGARVDDAGGGAVPVRAFPRQLGDWVAVEEKGLGAEMERVIGADQVTARRYLHVPSGTMAEVFVGYFASQAPGLLADREPHLPTVCLPAAGWTITRQEMAGDVHRIQQDRPEPGRRRISH